MVYNGDNDNSTMAMIYIYILIIMVDIYNQWPFEGLVHCPTKNGDFP